MYLSVGSSYKIKGAMEKLAPGEPNEPRPVAAPPPAPSDVQYQAIPQAAQASYQPPPAYAPPVAAGVQLTADAKFGQVAIRVQPLDAEVLIDGEPWKGAPGAERLVVHLSAGTHRIEIRKEGFDAFVTAVEIRRGEVTVLNVSLARF
jgi:hypothetical protein